MFWSLAERVTGIHGVRKFGKGVGAPDVEKNIGRGDRAVRFIAGTIALTALSFIKKGFVIRYILGLIAIVGLVTAYLRFCPVYALIGYSSRKKKN